VNIKKNGHKYVSTVLVGILICTALVLSGVFLASQQFAKLSRSTAKSSTTSGERDPMSCMSGPWNDCEDK